MDESQPDSNFFSVRIVSIDHYMAPPIPGYDICYSSFQGGNVNEVPVIRVYGSTPAGQKTCVHIHRALPYLYVPCADIPLQPHQEGDAYTNAISLALEKALKTKGNAGSKRQHVHDCSLVRAKKFYGYHASEELFVKIYLYYPNDVSRAANLLLGGAVLDGSLQPHESHIPFILQFMVDYNLYGMGHLHLSKVKFRCPVPDVFSPRKFNYNSQSGKEMDKLTQTSADFQADSSGSAIISSPLWVTSTIPSDWIWQFSREFEGSSGQNIHCIKRQSVCELEGDTTVDDIVNQQFIMFTSLSQTCSDVKMVQSLIAIWEEEYKRTGMHEAAMPPDPGKPLAQDVLKALTIGVEFENALRELNGETISPEPGQLSCLKERNTIAPLPPQGLLHQVEMDAIPDKEKDASPIILSGGERQSSQMIGTPSLKATEIEALGLLKWLATSQAAEDINSDDELLCETILSPLLPETTIDKVLDKANMDYVRESQKECQDILDSIEDVINFDSLKERSCSADSNNHPQISLKKTIPQIDGSSDDLYFPPSAGLEESLSKTDVKTESKSSFQHQISPDGGTILASKQNMNKNLWSSLSFSVIQKVKNNLEPVSFNITDSCVTEVKEAKASGFLAGHEFGKCSDVLKENEDAGACDMKEATTISACSVRDLMRRKRCYRAEPSECGSCSVKRVLVTEEQEEDVSLCTKQLDLHTLQNYKHDKYPRQSTLSLSSVQTEKNKLPWPSNTKEEESAINLGHCGAHIGKQSDYGAVSPETINFNVCTSESDSLYGVKLLNLDAGVKPLADERLQQTDAAGSSCSSFSSSPVQCQLFGLVDKDGHAGRMSMDKVLGNSKEICVGIDTTNDTSLPKSQECAGGEGKQDNCLSRFGCVDTVDVNMEAKSQNLIAMTFCRKPPITDYGDGVSENASCSSKIPSCFSLVDVEDHEGRGLDEILPFFELECCGERESHSKHVNDSNYNFKKEVAMGVPSQYLKDGCCFYMLTPAFSPPVVDSVNRWLKLHHDEDFSEEVNKASVEPPSLKEFLPDGNGVTVKLQNEGLIADANVRADCFQDISQISAPDGSSRPTPLSQIGFRDPASIGAGEQLTLLSIEVQAECRGDLRPDPRYDAVNLVALAFQNDNDSAVEVYVLLYSNILNYERSLDGILDCKVFGFSEEKHLFRCFTKILCSFDPDILMGWDIQGGSLGFLAERAAHLGIGLLDEISRTPSESKIAAGNLENSERDITDNLLPESVFADSVLLKDAIIEDEWGRTHASGVHVGGRIVLNVWRLMRGEVKLNMYTVEAVAEAVLRRKTPLIPDKVLTKWFSSGPGRARHRCIEYVVGRVKLNFEIMNKLDMINRTSELARVFGIDFFSVLSRGSQYRVESMFLRLAHTQNYLAISPANHQVASQPAMECLPLVMEPESGFYEDPVVVLDFQSLYPSMIIAYNLCFSTCLGKIIPSKENTLGVSSFSPDPCVLRDLKNQILVTPNGVMYVPPKVRIGVLPRLLEEILSTRIMVKQAMKKLAPSQQVLQRIFNARQLALKLIANVTYGYTAAGFSGRMPCAELADSIVQCGRSTLEKAISFVNGNDKWKAKVIYGDTDSMFVLLKGRTVKESFQIGHEIASAVSAMNPNPVTLKLEKVYHPCFLLTKKRYVGYSCESPDQTEPTFDAKGIETVRRDTCGAVAKIMEKSLRLFFDHQDISEVKAYLQRQWTRILSSRVSIQDFVFAKEVRLGTYSSRPSASLPPAAIVATKAMRADPRAEPRYGERVPYVVIHGEPGARLVDIVVDPLDLLAIDSSYRLNDLYYINKQIIPALQRVFGLVGADLNNWFLEMPRPGRDAFAKRLVFASNPRRSRIDYYYLSKHCVLCGELVQASVHLCNNCSRKETTAATALIGRTSKIEGEMQHLVAICRHCGGGDWLVESGVKCTSLACSVFYERRKVQKELQGLSAIAADKGFYPSCMVEWF